MAARLGARHATHLHNEGVEAPAQDSIPAEEEVGVGPEAVEDAGHFHGDVPRADDGAVAAQNPDGQQQAAQPLTAQDI